MIGKQRILIVDDDENIAELISLYLTKECFDTKIVFNGEDALSTFETYEPNLILLDLMLPGIDGYQVCREIRAKSGVPIIMLFVVFAIATEPVLRYLTTLVEKVKYYYLKLRGKNLSSDDT